MLKVPFSCINKVTFGLKTFLENGARCLLALDAK